MMICIGAVRVKWGSSPAETQHTAVRRRPCILEPKQRCGGAGQPQPQPQPQEHGIIWTKETVSAPEAGGEPGIFSNGKALSGHTTLQLTILGDFAGLRVYNSPSFSADAYTQHQTWPLVVMVSSPPRGKSGKHITFFGGLKI